MKELRNMALAAGLALTPFGARAETPRADARDVGADTVALVGSELSSHEADVEYRIELDLGKLISEAALDMGLTPDKAEQVKIQFLSHHGAENLIRGLVQSSELNNHMASLDSAITVLGDTNPEATRLLRAQRKEYVVKALEVFLSSGDTEANKKLLKEKVSHMLRIAE